MSKNLVFSVVGDKSYHKEWLGVDSDFDLALVYYGDKDDVALNYKKDSKYFFYQKTKSKFGILQKILLENSHIFNEYDYVWVPDDDLYISSKNINYMFSVAKEYDLWLSQPSLTGNITMDFLKQKDGVFIRYVNFVEQMAPLFKKEILFYLASTFDATESLWGVEHVWNALLKCPKDKIAIINNISINHMKKVGTDYSRFNISPLVEIDVLKNIYQNVLNFEGSIDLIEYNLVMEKKMKSIVTGGAGFIGSNLVDKLLELGHEVIVIDNEYSDAHDHFYWNDKTENYKLDIRDYDATRKLYDGVDYVFHIAAESRIQPAINNPIEAVSINSVGTATVLQCAREAGVKRVMYSSTSSAYGRNTIPNIETQPDDCLNPYSVSKVSGEKLCSMYTDLFGLDTIIFRYFNVYGERQPTKGQYAPVIGLFLKQAKNGEQLTIVGDGEQRRDFTHVSDVVNANILAALTDVDKTCFGKVYNVGNGMNYSVNQIAAMISDNTINIPPRLGESRVTLADNNRLRDIFSWEPKVDLATWISNNLSLN